MFRAHATTPHAQGQLHLDVHRSAFVEAAIDVAWATAWILLWLAFLASLAQPVALPGVAGGAGAPAGEETRGGNAQPDPGPSSWGVARADPAGAG